MYAKWETIKEPRMRWTSETKWAVIWGLLLTSVAVAEIIAVRSHDPKAPLSHHVRKHTHIMGKSPIGRAMLFVGAGWLHRHLYEPFIKEVGKA